MKASKISALFCAAAVISCAPSAFAGADEPDYFDKSDREAYTQSLLENESVKKYYDIVTADMSWLNTNTFSFTVLDVTGDHIPELIVSDSVRAKADNGSEYNKKLRKFYSLKTDKPEFMYAVRMSRDYLTPYYDGDELKWLYSDYMHAGTGDDYVMTREYGLMTFTDEKVTKTAKFKAYECLDKENDTLEYSYTNGKTVYGSRTVSGYSKKKSAADKLALQKYKSWYKAAGLWEAEEFDGDTVYRLEPVNDRYTMTSDGDIFGISVSDRYEETEGKSIKKTKSMFRMNIAEILSLYFTDTAPYILTDDHYYSNSDMYLAAAKPVIYLYPEKREDITVTMDLNGSFVCTYPKYNNGWSVTADPDGTVYCGGEEYSYLYWDAELDGEWDLSKGFVVKGEDTADFLREKLSFMGLTPREYNEFIVYWLPQLEKNPYNLITFQTDAYENAAKLNISPEPDSILRIFMVYVPLEEYAEVPEQELEAFERKGFTVIEWGGASAQQELFQ